MIRKILSGLGVILVLFAFSSCSSKPEQGILKSYFHAIALNDLTTMSQMALEPVTIDAQRWEILSIGEEAVEPAALPELNQKELELKKKVEESVGPVLDAKDELDDAKFEQENARGAEKRALQKKVDELQAKYDEIYEIQRNVQREYNEAKAAANKEEEITFFSLSARVGDFPTIREWTGTVHKKPVDIKTVAKDGTTKDYRVYMRRYELKDEALNLQRRGRWVIIRFEQLS